MAHRGLEQGLTGRDAFGRGSRRDRRARLRLRLLVPSIIVAGLALSCVAFFSVKDGERLRIRTELERNAEHSFAALHTEIESDLEVLTSINAAYSAFHGMKRAEFAEFVRPILAQHPGIQAVEWIPAVPDAQREAYEEAARRDGFPGFQFTERLKQGVMARAAVRPEYFPVYYVEPYKGNEIALGFDLASNAARRDALEQARKTGRTVATSRITLVQETGEQFGIIVFDPVYRDVAPQATAGAPSHELEGFSLGVFRIGDMLEQSLAGLKLEGTNIWLLDLSAPAHEQFLSYHPASKGATPAPLETPPAGWPLRHAARFDVGGRTWVATYVPTEAFLSARRTWVPWGVLAMGILLTGLAAGIVVVSVKRAEDAVGANVDLAREIDERLQAERALRESEERYRLIAENTADVIWTLDLARGRLTYVSPSVQKLRGFTPEEVMARPYLESVTAEYRPRVEAELKARLAALAAGDRSAGTGVMDLEELAKDGSAVPTEVVATALLGPAGDVTGVLGVTRDRRERKRAEAALAESEERYRSIFQDSPMGIYRTTPDGRILAANPALLAMLGYDSFDELASGNLETVGSAPGYDRASFKKAIERDGLVRGFESVWTGNGGRRVFVRENARVVRDPKGVVLRYEGAAEDISERKRLEAELRQAQKMEAVGQLAGGVAHDFNNLLQAILSYAQLLRSQTRDPERVLAAARQLEEHAARGASLTRQLLLFSRRETAKPERLDLNDVVQGAVRMLRRLVRENVSFEVAHAPGRLPVEADRGQLEQVLMNLVVNASDAMPEGGRLTIRTGVDWPAMVWFAVEDTGHGIPAKIREHIFEPFFTTKEAGKGTGLGLAVVHGIVTQHGGRIEVESEAGAGTTFKVILPGGGSGEVPAAPGAQETPAELPLGRGERVLVVEDEATARDALRDILVSLRYEVAAVGSGEEAGRLAETPPFDLLLTDLMLPDVAGHELAVGLQARWPAMRVILMSGYAEDEAVRRGIETGRVRFLQKPFDMATLATAIRAALAG